MTAPTLEAERAALAAFPLSDSPHTSVKMRADDDRAAYKAGYLAAHRTAAPVAEGVALPPLDERHFDTPDLRESLAVYAQNHSQAGEDAARYEVLGVISEQVRQAQREAVEADRRARRPDGMSTALAEVTDRLGREAAENLSLKMELRALNAKLARQARQPAQSIDTPEFTCLATSWSEVRELNSQDDKYEDVRQAWAALIAYIDGRTAGTAPDLIEALKPFADAYAPEAERIARFYTPEDIKKYGVAMDRNTITPAVTMGDFRRAYEAYMLAAAPLPLPPQEEGK